MLTVQESREINLLSDILILEFMPRKVVHKSNKKVYSVLYILTKTWLSIEIE
jgi:hypothetical protein